MEDNEKVVNAEAEQSASAIKESKKAVAEPVAEKATTNAIGEKTEKETAIPAKTETPATPPAHVAARPARQYDNKPDRAQGGDRDRSQRSYGPRPRRKKVCQFCIDRQEFIDYKDIGRLRKFISERAKILPRRVTGTCAQHQREMTLAVKKARQIALLPYVSD